MNIDFFLNLLGKKARVEAIPTPNVTDKIMRQLQQVTELEDEWFTLACFGSATTLAAAFSVFIALYQWQSSNTDLSRLVVTMMNGGM
jgi:hypothetical protein